MLFGSVKTVNNKFYVTGVTSTIRSPYYGKAVFGKIEANGAVDFINAVVDSDNYNYDIFWNSLKKTADGNFIVTGDVKDSIQKAFLMKVDSNGQILFWHEYTEAGNLIFQGDDLIELPDSGYLLAINIARSDLISDVMIIRTDINGNIINKRDYFNGNVAYPQIIRAMSNGHYMVGAWSGPTTNNTPYRAKTWLIEVDRMGNEVRNWVDTVPKNLWPNGMEQTADSGWIIVRQHVAYDVSNFQELNASVLKLDKNFNKEWELHLGDSSDLTGFYDIKILPDGKYLACGTTPIWGTDSAYYWGWLVKIDINGTVLWDRKYTSKPQFGAHSMLSSMEYLPNGDIVACGQLDLTFSIDNSAIQQGWIIHTDSNGCLIDNCGRIGVGIDELNSSQQAEIKVYPNPARDCLQFETSIATPGTILSIYDMYGRAISQKELSVNGITTISTLLWNSGLFLWIIRENEIPVGQGKLEIMK